MNALTESAEPIGKEVGPTGALETILELLQSRFGNKLKLENFQADLRRRKRGPDETLQDLYLDLCRLRALATSEDSDEKFPEKYFRNIFVDALNDRELRRSVLVQNPGTMEEAYRVATQLETIDAYDTPVSDVSRMKPRTRQLDLGNESPPGPQQSLEPDETMARRLVELENEVQSLRAEVQRPASYFPNIPLISQDRQSVQDSSPCRLVVRHEAMILLKSHSGTRRCDTTRGDDPATITFKTLHFQQPSYLAALVPRYVPTRSLRSASSLLICAPSRKTAMAESRSFSSVASDFWNRLPCHLTSISAFPAFRKRLKHHLFSNAFPGVSSKSTDITFCDVSASTNLDHIGCTLPPS